MCTFPVCRLRIINDILGTSTTMLLPESVEEAEQSCVVLQKARRFAEELELRATYGEPDDDIGVTIRTVGDTVTIRWWAEEGTDPAKARERLAAVLSGRAFA